jgi:3-oxoadipate enol-lactonase
MIVSVNGVRLAFDDNGNGLPVVFVHAFPLSRAMWSPQVEALAGRWRPLTVDLRGHGESDAPLWRYTLDQFADDLRGLFDHLSLPSAVLVGLSMGGYTLFAFYRKYPERVKALVLADTRAQADTEEARANRFQLAQVAYRQGPAAVADAMMPKLFTSTTLQGNPALVQRVRRIIELNQVSGIAGDLMAMAERPDSRELLGRIHVPTLVVVGEQDTATPAADAEVIASGIRNSRLAVIPGAGHLANLEAPDAFNQALTGFLETLGGGNQRDVVDRS